MNLYDKLKLALDNGMNIKLVLMATGLDLGSFWRYFEDELFSADMRIELELVLKEWEG